MIFSENFSQNFSDVRVCTEVNRRRGKSNKTNITAKELLEKQIKRQNK